MFANSAFIVVVLDFETKSVYFLDRPGLFKSLFNDNLAFLNRQQISFTGFYSQHFFNRLVAVIQ